MHLSLVLLCSIVLTGLSLTGQVQEPSVQHGKPSPPNPPLQKHLQVHLFIHSVTCSCNIISMCLAIRVSVYSIHRTTFPRAWQYVRLLNTSLLHIWMQPLPLGGCSAHTALAPGLAWAPLLPTSSQLLHLHIEISFTEPAIHLISAQQAHCVLTHPYSFPRAFSFSAHQNSAEVFFSAHPSRARSSPVRVSRQTQL